MYCRNCATSVHPEAAACLSCGLAPKSGTAYCQNCGCPTLPKSQICTRCASKLVVVAQNAAKSRLAAGLLGVFLGGLGVHRFYLGFVGVGILQVIATFLSFGIGSIWGFVEGILILTGAMHRDAQGRPLKD